MEKQNKNSDFHFDQSETKKHKSSVFKSNKYYEDESKNKWIKKTFWLADFREIPKLKFDDPEFQKKIMLDQLNFLIAIRRNTKIIVNFIVFYFVLAVLGFIISLASGILDL